MAKTYIDTAQIEMWEHIIHSEYSRGEDQERINNKENK